MHPKHARGASHNQNRDPALVNSNESVQHRKTKSQESYQNPEELIQQVKESRSLHTPKPKLKLNQEGPIFDHFIVVGTRTPENDAKKEILFKYPVEMEVNIPGIEEFCFPGGIITKEIPYSECKSAVIEMTHTQSYLRHPENSFVFLITNEQHQIHFGICVHKEELLETPPCFVPGWAVDLGDRHVTTMRCYCLISRYPFFRLHFDFVFQLFAIEHLTRLERQKPSIEHDHGGLSSSAPCQKPKLEAKPNRVSGVQDDHQITNVRKTKSRDMLRQSTAGNFNSLRLKRSESSFPERARKKKTCSPFDPKSLCTSEQGGDPCLGAFHRYYSLAIPGKGNRVHCSISQYLNALNFDRPFFDEEEELLAEWGLPLLLYHLSMDTLIKMLSAILLEKKVLVVCENLRVLSGIVLSIPALIRPFVYQWVVIAMIPLPNRWLIEAIPPFIMGIDTLPEEIPPEIVIIDVLKNRVISNDPIPIIPHCAALEKKCTPILQTLRDTFTEIPYYTSAEQLACVQSISTEFEIHLSSLFDNFDNYTICSMTDPTKPITVFMNESFLEDIPDPKVREFIEPFLLSQIFFHYQEKRLLKRDKRVRVN